MGDPVFDEFFASTVPSLSSQAEQGEKIKHAGSLLLDKIGVRENEISTSTTVLK